MSDFEALLRPTAIRAVGDARYAIDLADATGTGRTINITLRWSSEVGGWGASEIEGYSMSEPARFDTRPMVGLAVAMHKGIHYQFDPVGFESETGDEPPRTHPVNLG